MIFTLNLDDFAEESFHYLEDISEGKRGHYCDVEANNKLEAAEKIGKQLTTYIYYDLKKDLKKEK